MDLRNIVKTEEMRKFIGAILFPLLIIGLLGLWILIVVISLGITDLAYNSLFGSKLIMLHGV